MVLGADEDEFAYYKHAAIRTYYDSDSDDGKSDFDDWYYDHKPPSMSIEDLVIIKIYPPNMSFVNDVQLCEDKSKKRQKNKRRRRRKTEKMDSLSRASSVDSRFENATPSNVYVADKITIVSKTNNNSKRRRNRRKLLKKIYEMKRLEDVQHYKDISEQLTMTTDEHILSEAASKLTSPLKDEIVLASSHASKFSDPHVYDPSDVNDLTVNGIWILPESDGTSRSSGSHSSKFLDPNVYDNYPSDVNDLILKGLSILPENDSKSRPLCSHAFSDSHNYDHYPSYVSHLTMKHLWILSEGDGKLRHSSKFWDPYDYDDYSCVANDLTVSKFCSLLKATTEPLRSSKFWDPCDYDDYTFDDNDLAENSVSTQFITVYNFWRLPEGLNSEPRLHSSKFWDPYDYDDYTLDENDTAENDVWTQVINKHQAEISKIKLISLPKKINMNVKALLFDMLMTILTEAINWLN
ncbi:hypothetical protein FQR65_LT09618 [Abscondita terminalis]|nr:hypothetical protein FQR65_LT09618 [Abscondita terminalis]